MTKPKSLDPADVKRSDKGRERAEAVVGKRGPGRPRKDGSPAQPSKAKSVEEATKRVKAATPAPAPAPAELDWREPTPGEIAMVKFHMRMGNKPLVQLERDLAQVGIVSNVEGALVKPGEIPASEEELDNGAHCVAGTLTAFAPNFLRYMAPIGLVFFTVGFLGSRALIFLRIKRALDDAERQEREAREAREAMKNKIAPGTVPGNGTQAPRGELLPLASSPS